MYKLTFILGLFLISSVLTETENVYDLGENIKTSMNPAEGQESISENSKFYFKTNYLKNMILQLTVPKDSTISFEVGIASFEVEPSKAEVSDASFSQISQYTKTSDEEEDIYTFSLIDFTDENKPFVALSIKNANPVSYFTILVKNNEQQKGIKVFNLAFNKLVVLQQEGDIETPIYFNVTLSEPITQNKISFNIKVKKDDLKSPVCSISGYNGYPDITRGRL